MPRHLTRVSDEDGLGLVEIMISIMLIGIILAGLASSLITTLHSVRVAERTSLATALHQESLERDLALPWALIGVYTDDPDYQATVTQDGDTYPTVGIVPTPPKNLAVQPRVRQEVREGVTFDVTRDVYWVDTDGDGTSEGKRIRTAIEWSEGGNTSRTEFYALRLPTIDEEPDAFEVLLFEPSPSVVEIDEAGLTTEDVTITVNTTLPAAAPVVTYETQAGDATAEDWIAVTGDATNWRGVIPAGSGPVNATETVLKLSVASASAPPTTKTSAITLVFTQDAVDTGGEFEIQQFTAAPTTAKVTGKANICDVTFTVRVNGFTSDDLVDIEYEYWVPIGKDQGNTIYEKSGKGGAEAEHTGQTGSVATFTAVLRSSGDEYFMLEDPVKLTAFATRAGTSNTRTAPLTLPLVYSGKENQC